MLLFGMFSFGLSIVSPLDASAQASKSAACEALGDKDCGENTGGANLTSVLRLVINILTVIAGFLAIVFIIVAGVKYITSGGDSSKLASAKNSLIYAIIGLIIVALSQFMVRFVLAKSSEATQSTTTTAPTKTPPKPAPSLIQ